MAKRNRNHQKKQKSQLSAENPGRDWAELPRPILESIFDRLSLVDCVAISNVCKSWRNVFSPELSCWESLGFPSLLMSGQRDRDKRTCVGMLEKRAWEMEIPEARGKYCWGSAHDWLVLVDNVDHFSVDITLFNPFTGGKIELPRTWDFYHKIVLSGRPSEKKRDFVCMLVSSQSREVEFWAPGARSWRNHKLIGDPFEDAVFCDGSFFLLTKENDVFQIDVASVVSASSDGSEIETRLRKVVVPEGSDDTGGGNGVLRYLVECRGDVLLVCRRFNNDPGAMLETRGFKVYALEVDVAADEMSWKRVESLGDRALFLGKCSSMSFSASRLGVGTTNAIYFSNDNDTPWSNEWHSYHLRGMSSRFGLNNSGRKHWGVFRLGRDDDDNTGDRKFCFRGDRDNSGPIWFAAPLWWYCNNFTINQ